MESVIQKNVNISSYELLIVNYTKFPTIVAFWD